MKIIHSRCAQWDYPEMESLANFTDRLQDEFTPQDMFDGARFGPAILAVIEDDDGRMYVFNGEYASQVNYCPFTGQRATVQIGKE